MASRTDKKGPGHTSRPRSGSADDDNTGRYPALELWETIRRQGMVLSASDPLERAACREANARELDGMAANASCLREAAVWRKAADAERAESRAILAHAQQQLMAREA